MKVKNFVTSLFVISIVIGTNVNAKEITGAEINRYAEKVPKLQEIKVEAKEMTSKEIIKNIENKDKQKPDLKEIKVNKLGNGYVSEQNNLKIEIKDKKVSIKNKEKGNIKLGIPDEEKIEEVILEGNKLVFKGKNSNIDTVVESIDGGVRQIVTIKSKDESRKFYEFPLELDKGDNISIEKEGNGIVKDKNGKVKLVILTPWAKDAEGKDLKTWYKTSDNKLRQYIDLSSAKFPVIADPAWCGAVINNVSWIYRQPYWSASVNPTWCGRAIALSSPAGVTAVGYAINSYFSWESWIELIRKTPYNSSWNIQYGNNQYWSMYNQFRCHLYNSLTSTKDNWNLEPARPNVGLWNTYTKGCNP